MVGLIGKKMGMTQVFDETGALTPVTVIKIDENVVIGNRTIEKNGYTACILGSIDKKPKGTTKPYAGQFPEGVTPKRFVREMRDFDQELEIGSIVGLELLQDITYVDVIGSSKGKGFQGVMKRHGFSGGKKTHGSKFHRGLGSTGMAAWPSKVHKGSKMPGRMGNEKVTAMNLRVVKVDVDRRVLLVKGAVPGVPNGMVLVRNAKKKVAL
jgi:large subunit ribosomal protein L3